MSYKEVYDKCVSMDIIWRFLWFFLYIDCISCIACIAYNLIFYKKKIIKISHARLSHN